MSVTVRKVVLGLLLWGMLVPALALRECPACHRSFGAEMNFCPFDGKPLAAVADRARGSLEILVSPAHAAVSVGGLPHGTGPRLNFSLPEGKHSLEATAPGYSPSRLSFSIAEGQSLALRIELVPLAAPAETTTDIASPAEGLEHRMVKVRPGTYLLGSDRGNPDERPLRRVRTNGFRIDMHEVTNAQYQRFLEDIRRYGHRWCHPSEPPNKDHTPFHTYAWALRFSWFGGKPPAGMEDHPVVLVDWFDAYAYASWAGKRLPSEDEWEIAAGGGRGVDYPWGNEFDPILCNVGDEPMRVGSFPGGASPWGALDMAGNVAEWTATAYESNARYGKPFTGRFGRPVIRGGSWDDESRGCRVSARDVFRSPFYRSTTVGFRCVVDLPASVPPPTSPASPAAPIAPAP